MRKLTIFAAGIIAAATVLLSTGGAAGEPPQGQPSAEEQVILRLLRQPVKAAVEDFYNEHRQYWRQDVLGVRKIPDSAYGLETMTFYVGPLDEVQLISFDHQDEAD